MQNVFLQIAERNPYIVNLASQLHGERIHKRDLGYSNIRIHPLLTGSVTSSYSSYVQGNDSVLSKAIDTLQRALQIHPVQGNLIIPPICEEYTNGSNEGKCMSPLPNQTEFECGDLGIVPHSYIGTREVCDSPNGSCTIEGPNGPGLPNADYLLFVSVSHTCKLVSLCIYVVCNSFLCFMQCTCATTSHIVTTYVYVHIIVLAEWSIQGPRYLCKLLVHIWKSEILTMMLHKR